MINDLSFQGRTEFSINPNAYRKVEKSVKNAYTYLTKNSSCRLNHAKVNTIKTSPDYLTIILKGENDGYIQSIPVSGKINYLLVEINDKVDKLRKITKKEKLTAWILGGIKGEKTTKAVNEVAEILCEKPDIDASILAGSHTGEDLFVVHSTSNKFELQLDKKRLNPKRHIETELEQIFDINEFDNVRFENSQFM